MIVNRHVVGITPLHTQLPLPAGTTTLRVTVAIAGHQPYTFDVDATRGRADVHAALQPLPSQQVGVAPVAAAPMGFEAPPTHTAGEATPVYGRRPRHRFAGSFGLFAINNDTPAKMTVIGLGLEAQFRLLGNDGPGELGMDLRARWSFVSLFAGDLDAEARPNNPTLVLEFGSRFGPMRIYGGPGVTAPVAAAVDDDPGRFGGCISCLVGILSHAFAGRMNGNVEIWDYAASHMALHARGGIEARFDAGYVGAEMALGVLPGIDTNLYLSANNMFAWQLLFFGAARPVRPLSVGGRLGVAYLRDLEAMRGMGYDDVYVSLETFVRTHFGAGFLGLRFLLNMTDDGRTGFSFDDNGVWGLWLDAGVELE